MWTVKVGQPRPNRLGSSNRFIVKDARTGRDFQYLPRTIVEHLRAQWPFDAKRPIIIVGGIKGVALDLHSSRFNDSPLARRSVRDDSHFNFLRKPDAIA